MENLNNENHEIAENMMLQNTEIKPHKISRFNPRYLVVFGLIGIALVPFVIHYINTYLKYNDLKADYNTVITNYEEAESNRVSLVDKYNDLVRKNSSNSDAKLNEAEAEKASVEQAFAEYKEAMQQYEGLSAAEAEAKKIEAEKIVQAKKEEDERLAAEAEAKKEAEEKMGYETGITYEQLARTPDNYVNKKVKFTGKVVQVSEGTTSNTIRFAVDSDYDTIILCQYDKAIISLRILEDDIITIYGVSNNLYSYTSTLGATITLPYVLIDKIDQ